MVALSLVAALLAAGAAATPFAVAPAEAEPAPRLERRQAVAIESCTVPGTVALTFDDSPYIYTDSLLDKLAAAGMKATFFLNGQNWASIYDYTATVQRMVRDGHQVGSHTWSHADLATLNTAGVTAQMQQLDTAFNTILGKMPTYMRPPYFSYTQATLNTLNSLGYKVIDADIDTVDWDNQANIAVAVNNFQQGLNAGGSIVLAHDVHANTVSGLVPQMINIIGQRGLRAVTVGECRGDAPANWYRTSGGSTPPPTNPPPTNPPPGGVISPDGTCAGANQYHCPSGTCCSQWGWCGVETGHCGAGCNPTYGMCR